MARTPPVPPEPDARLQRSWRRASIAYAVVLSTGTHWPNLRFGAEMPASDKTVHLLAFAGLTVLVARTGWVSSPWRAGLLVGLWSILDELTQGLPGLGRDVGLPDMTGFEVCKTIRKTQSLPILFLTARSSEVDRVVGLEIGGDDYVVKPFSPRELVARVRAILRRVSAMPLPTNGHDISIPLVIDEVRCQAIYFGTGLNLSRYEFRMLKAFAAHPGRVFSSEQLMDHASEEPDASMERTVDTHVKTLRARMRGVLEGLDPIVTHRGMGYSLLETWPDA